MRSILDGLRVLGLEATVRGDEPTTQAEYIERVTVSGDLPSWADVQAAMGPQTSDVQAERARRLALGFDYDFGSARGVHRIGTTPQDMAGWRDVTDYANALIDLGDVTTTIAIVTDTGPALVTAPEWQAVLLRAAEVRQAIWAASFALQAMSPIPTDFADDSRWA